MDIIIQSLGFNASIDLESFITEKVSGLKGDRIIRANVTLYKGPASTPEGDYCEIRLEVPGNDHFVKKNSQDFEMAVLECVDILSQKIKDERDIRIRKRKADEAVIQDALMTLPDDNDDVELEDVVK